MNDVDLQVGADTSPAAAGLASLRNYGQKAHTELQSVFATAITLGGVAGIIAGLDSIVQKAHEIHHESARFGIDAEQLQMIGNAAKQEGIELTEVARAMNKMLVGGEAALKNQTALRVDMAAFAAANPAEKVLLIADAFKEAGLNTASYDAIAKIFGTRFGTQIIPLLSQGREEIVKLSEEMATMTSREIEDLERLRRGWESLKSVFVSVGAVFIAGLEEPIEKALIRISATLRGVNAQLTYDTRALLALAQGNFTQAGAEHAEGLRLAGEISKDQLAREARIGAPAAPGAFKGSLDSDLPAASGPSSSAGHGPGGASLDNRLEKLQRENYLAQLNADEKIRAIDQERADLQEKLNRGRTDGNLTLDEDENLQAAILEKESEVTKLKDEQNTAQDAYNQKASQARQAAEDEAEKELETAAQAVRLLELKKQYGNDVGQKLYEEEQAQQKILDLTDRINQAWAEGNQALAETLTDLRDELTAEQNITSEIDKQAAARKAMEQAKADAAAREKAAREGFGINPGSDRTLSALEQGITGVGFEDDASIMATDPYTGKVDPRQLEINRAKMELVLLHGGSSAWSVVDIMARKKAIALNFDRTQEQQRKAQEQAQTMQEEAYWQAIASGRWTGAQVDQWPRFQLPAGTALGFTGRGGPNYGVTLQEILAQLKTLNGSVKSGPPTIHG